MSKFYPDLVLHRISELTPAMLAQLGVTALILDVDNTLTTHNNPVPDSDVLLWLKSMGSSNIRLVIVSNNSDERVAAFAKMLGLGYTANALKPLKKGFAQTAAKLRLPPQKIGVVGDQIFTDILGGNLFGAKTILVAPMEPETGPFFRLKRKLEVLVLRGYANQKAGKR